MGAEPSQLHVAFFPWMAPGHTIPMIDMVRLFAARHVKTTIITTPLNAPNFAKSLNGTDATLEIFTLPSNEVGLPQGIENMKDCASPEIAMNFMRGTQLLRGPLEELLEKIRPDCLIADAFFPFASESAARFGVTMLVFHGTSFFALCANVILFEHKPYMSVSSDDDSFVIPNLPHLIRLTRLQIPPEMRENKESDVLRIVEAGFLSLHRSYGTIVNSFYELEPEYADCYRKGLGRRAWHIGPLSLCNKDFEGKSQRGNKASINGHECLKWLDSKEPNSVIYVCFGSLTRFSSSQLREIAMAFEDSGQQFIWVVKKPMNEEEDDKGNDPWLPEGFEKRTRDQGLIIRGWAPQVLILEHEAIGGFVTHCGWNSTLEGITAGVPMVTWPLFAEQFLNEKLVTEILKVGIPIGVKGWSMPFVESNIIKQEQIEAAFRQLMVDEEALEMRSRAKKLKEMARKAMEEGGSSHSDLSALLQDLSSYSHNHHSSA